MKAGWGSQAYPAGLIRALQLGGTLRSDVQIIHPLPLYYVLITDDGNVKFTRFPVRGCRILMVVFFPFDPSF